MRQRSLYMMNVGTYVYRRFGAGDVETFGAVLANKESAFLDFRASSLAFLALACASKSMAVREMLSTLV